MHGDQEATQRVFEATLVLRELEITQLTQRNNFFMIFQGVLFAGVLQSAGGIPVVSFLGCLAGFIISILQAGMAAGAKYWQERWELGTENAERILLGQIDGDKQRSFSIQMFDTNLTDLQGRIKGRFPTKGPCSLINRLILLKPSVSRIPIYAGIVFSGIWLLLLLSTIQGPLEVPHWIVGFSRVNPS